jgi:F-type H+-transporting ATPase subunit b
MVFLAFAEGGIQLLPDGTILIHIALILLMIFILNRTFFRPINKVIESREKNKGGHSTEAEEILQKVEEKNARFDAEMLEARTKGYELIEQERRQAVVQREETITSVKAEVEQKVANDYQELESQTATARAAIAEEADKMSDKISSNILKAA